MFPINLYWHEPHQRLINLGNSSLGNKKLFICYCTWYCIFYVPFTKLNVPAFSIASEVFVKHVQILRRLSQVAPIYKTFDELYKRPLTLRCGSAWQNPDFRLEIRALCSARALFPVTSLCFPVR